MDPNGERTIGILTKVDLIDEGLDAGALISPFMPGQASVYHHPQTYQPIWLFPGAIMASSDYKLEHGFFAIKGPSYKAMTSGGDVNWGEGWSWLVMAGLWSWLAEAVPAMPY